MSWRVPLYSMVTISGTKSECIRLLHATDKLHRIMASNLDCKMGLSDMLNEEGIKPNSHIIFSPVSSSIPLQSDTQPETRIMPGAVDVTEFAPVVCTLHWSQSQY